MAFRLLALAVPDPVKTELKIAYPERNTVECTLLAIVFSINAGKVINRLATSRLRESERKRGTKSRDASESCQKSRLVPPAEY